MKASRILCLCGLAWMAGCKPDSGVPEGYDEYGNRLVRSVTKHIPGWDWQTDFRYDESGRITNVTEVLRDAQGEAGEIARYEYAFERSGSNLEVKAHLVTYDFSYEKIASCEKIASWLAKKGFRSVWTKAGAASLDTTFVEARFTLNGDSFVAEGWTRSEGDVRLEYEEGRLRRLVSDGLQGTADYTWVDGDLRLVEFTGTPASFSMSYGLDSNKTNIDIPALIDDGLMRKWVGSRYVGLFRYMGEKSIHLPLAFSDGGLSVDYAYTYDAEGLPVKVEVQSEDGGWDATWEFDYE